jgi:intein-encoded DNA endonuclease-like protein
MTVMTLLVAMEWNLKRGFLRYKVQWNRTALPRLATELESRYTEKGTWDFIRRDREAWSATVIQCIARTTA